MFKYVALLAVFIPLSAKTQIFIQQEDHLPAYEKHLELQSDPFVVPGRYRMARMDRNEALRSVEHGAPLVFNLFNDVEMRANVQKVKDLANGSRFVSGELAGGGYFTLFFHNSGIIRGELHSIRGTYTLKSEGNDFNQVLIKQEDLSDIPRCGSDLGESHTHDNVSHSGESRNGFRITSGMTNGAGTTKEHHVAYGNYVIPAKARISSKQATNNIIDVLVVYTQRVEDHEGGPTQIRAAIENEVADMNYVLENSGLDYRQIRLVHMEKVDYVQNSSGLGSDLQNLEYTSEDSNNDNDYSALDEVHKLTLIP